MGFEQTYLAALTQTENEILGGVDVDVVGLGVGDFVPFLKVAGGVAGAVAGVGGGSKGGSGGDSGDAITKMMMLQQQQQSARDQAARDQANRDASSRNQMFMFAGIGIVALGALFFLFKK